MPKSKGRLIRLAPAPFPRLAGWLAPGHNCSPLEYAIVQRALHDDGILEVPLGSNRGTRIDAMTRRAGLTPPVWWCAVWVGCVFADAGALVPEGFPACDSWLPFINSQTPRPGAAVLYGKPGDAVHIGIVARVESGLILTIEGNRGYAGSATNNGVAVDLAPLTRRDVLGYVVPTPAPAN